MRVHSENLAASLSATHSIGRHPRAALVAIVLSLTAACGSDPVRPGSAQPEIGFAVSYTAGTRDPSGVFMGGTEMRHLTAYRGKLYAGNGYWEDRPGPEGTQSAQVLVLDRPSALWRVEHSFDQPLPDGWPGKQLGAGAVIGLALAPIVVPRRDFAISALAGVTFTTDAAGRALPEPVSMLLAASWDVTGAVEVFGRDGATGTWTAMTLGQDRPTPDFLPMVRSLGVHRDRATGVDLVFAGADPRGIFAGVYDAGTTGRIRWASTPELDITTIDAASFPGLGGRLRVMSFAECDGVLYATVGQQIFERSDGAQPHWRPIYTNPFPGHSESGLRGLTAIAAPDGGGQVLLTAEEGHTGRIIRIDPRDGYKETTDLDLRAFLDRAWGTQVGYVIAAYNDMTKVPDGRGSELVLIGFEAFIPRTARWPEGHMIANGLEGGGWYLVRHSEGRYDLRRIATVHPDTREPLVATRAIAVSPFPDDAAVYFAGYDANKRRAHNTAWIFRAPLPAVLGEQR